VKHFTIGLLLSLLIGCDLISLPVFALEITGSGGGKFRDLATSYEISDDFIFSSTSCTTGNSADWVNWQVVSGGTGGSASCISRMDAAYNTFSVSRILVGHPGVAILSGVNASSYSSVSWRTDTSQYGSIIDSNELFNSTIVIKHVEATGSTGAVQFRAGWFGASDSFIATAVPANGRTDDNQYVGIFLEKLFADTNYFLVCRGITDPVTQVRLDTGVALPVSSTVAAAPWVKLTLSRSSSTVVTASILQLGGAATSVTLTDSLCDTTASASGTAVSWQIANMANGTRTSLFLDYFTLKVTGLNR